MLVANGEASERNFTMIFDRLLSGAMQAWAFYKDEHAKAILVTDIRNNSIFGSKELLVFAIFGVLELEEDDWIQGFNQLKEFAITMGCNQINAYTDAKGIAERARSLGGKVKYFILLEV